MKKFNLLLIPVFILTVIFSCNTNSYQKEVSKRLGAQFDDLKNYEMIVIIPSTGCTGCITNAEDFFVKNVSNDKMKFILTHIYSMKNLGLKLGKENIQSPNVFIDENDLFYLDEFEEKIYPFAISLKNGEIIKAVRLDSLN